MFTQEVVRKIIRARWGHLLAAGYITGTVMNTSPAP
jgi:hypothetical protein